jgi:hypothetical protein
MSRVYSVQFNNVAVTVAQDLFELTPADDKPIELIAAVVTVRDSETNEQFTCTVQRRSGAFTGGSGGSAPTPVKASSIDTAAGFTAEVNNTTRATGGTQEILHAEGWPSQGGWGFTPTPGAEPRAIQGEALVIGLENAPGASTNFNGTVWVREL